MKLMYVNGRFLTQSTTGVQRYATELLVALDALYEQGFICKNEFEIVVLLPSGQHDLPSMITLKHITLKPVGYLKGHLWEQVELPFYSRKGSLFSPCNTAPFLSLFNRNQKVLTTVHDLSYRYYPSAYSTLFKAFYSVLMPVVFRFSTALITVSSSEKKMIEKFYPNVSSKLFAIHHGVSEEFHYEKSALITKDFQDSYLIYVGSLSQRKNIQGVIDAFLIIRRSLEIKLLIVGASGSSFSSSSLVVPDALKPYIQFYGYTDSVQTLRSLYSSAECLIFPSFYESFGFPAVEAMACGCPVVVSNSSCLPEICGSAAEYCDPDDHTDIASKVISLIGDKEKRAEKVALGLNRSRSFSWRKSGKESLEIMKEVL